MLRTGEKGSGPFKPVSWTEALGTIVEHLGRIREESGPEAVVFYTGYPKWMRPFLKRLALGFGSPNYCIESSTCSTAAEVTARLNYGCFGKSDLAESRLLLVWSSNPFYSKAPEAKKLLAARDPFPRLVQEFSPYPDRVAQTTCSLGHPTPSQKRDKGIFFKFNRRRVQVSKGI